MSLPDSFLSPWSDALKTHFAEQASDFPAHHLPDPSALVTTSTPLSLRVGSGLSIFTDALLPAIASARREVILVTCFLANSDSLAALKATLEALARRRISEMAEEAESAAATTLETLRVRICFSSRSVLQKLLHTWSRHGHVYPPRQWPSLGLPDEALLREARVDMSVKSLFFLPFGVAHPKFLVVDGERAWMPSCNISWETWFETCVEFEGPAVDALLGFYSRVWELGEKPGRRPARASVSAGREGAGDGGPGGGSGLREIGADGREGEGEEGPAPTAMTATHGSNPWRAVRHFPGAPSQRGPAASVPTILLPSSHHQNPRFNSLIPFLPLPFLWEPPPPVTPLNAALSTLFANAQHHIRIVTPNITCGAVEAQLLGALGRGVDVEVVTSRDMMVLEQLVTALTTTARRLRSLVAGYERICRAAAEQRGGDVERGAGARGPGRLEVMYYKPDMSGGGEGEPVMSHVKMVAVDGEFVVLGSGNMDRASWYTSQELGVLFYGGVGWDVWDGPLTTRTEVVYPR